MRGHEATRSVVEQNTDTAIDIVRRRSPVRHDEVQTAVAIQVCHGNGAQVGTRDVDWQVREYRRAIGREDPHGARSVDECQIENAVPVQVARREGNQPRPGLMDLGRLERAIAFAWQDAQTFIDENANHVMGNNEVQFAVAVEIRHRYATRRRADDSDLSRMNCTFTFY